MKAHEETNMLESMIVLVDTREKPTERAKKRYEALGASYERRTLSYGDYTYNAQLPNGEWLFKDDETVCGYAIVERKESLDELASCLTHSRDRFEREFQRAKDHGARIFLLVENATWENLLAGRYRSQFNEKAFFASLCAWLVRYDLQLVFCKEETSGKIIKELLYRDLKQRIMDGFFDEHRD